MTAVFDGLKVVLLSNKLVTHILQHVFSHCFAGLCIASSRFLCNCAVA